MNIVKLGTRLENIDIDKYIFKILHFYDHTKHRVKYEEESHLKIKETTV